MDHANSLCRRFKDPAAVIRIVLQSIKERRAALSSLTSSDSSGKNLDRRRGDSEKAIPSVAFLIRQLKRPQEVHLLRRVYGKQFILISAYGDRSERKVALEKKIKRSLKISASEQEISSKADDLIFRDESEGDDAFGQHVRETFHLADLFVHGLDTALMKVEIDRFVRALFGQNDVGPTRTEYGMYAAKAASLRSLDLSRQVGAAIFSPSGELVTQGCNEVPRAGGGTYWEGEEPDNRDVKIGHDPNDYLKKEMLRDLLERLDEGGFLSDEAKALGASHAMVDALIYPPSHLEEEGAPLPQVKLGCLKDASIMEVTEYGRVVHAEMSAICDAARIGRSIRGGIVYCTTFPCHNCTKHIISSGVSKVIFIEPYPKSKAQELHENEISLEEEDDSRVSYIPFIGISPVKYRDIFQKSRSRKVKGVARDWYYGEPRPMIDVSGPAYLDNEAFEYEIIKADFIPNIPSTTDSEEAVDVSSVVPEPRQEGDR